MLLKRGRNNNKALVRQLQEGLAFFGFHPGSADGIFGGKTENAVEDWQEKAGIYADGIFGRGSAKKWNEWCESKSAPQFSFAAKPSSPDPAGPSERLSWVKCPATPMPNGHGFKRLYLRSDAAEAYMRLHQEVEDRGGYMTTAGGKRGLSSKASPARSKKSFHYTGRAFDLATYSSLQNPKTDPFLCVREGSRGWQVWCRVTDENAPLAHCVATVTLEVTTHRVIRNSKGRRVGQLRTQEWTGKAFNFSALADSHGFEGIRGRRSFFSGGSYGGAEWWHLQWVTGLERGVSTFGDELLKVYSLDQCKRFVYWNEAKDAVYGVSWF